MVATAHGFGVDILLLVELCLLVRPVHRHSVQSIEHWFFSLPLPIRMLVQIPVYSISCSANQRSITMRFRMLGMLV